LAPVPTFRLWRRMKLWELRSYEEVIRLEQDRLVYQTRLRARYGRSWRRKAPVESLIPLRLTRYGVPLTDTTPAGLTAAELEPSVMPATAHSPVARDTADEMVDGAGLNNASPGARPDAYGTRETMPQVNRTDPTTAHPAPAPQQAPSTSQQDQQAPDRQAQAVQPKPQHPQPTEPMGSAGRVRPLSGKGVEGQRGAYVPKQREPERYAYEERSGQPLSQIPDDVPRAEVYYATFRQFLADHNHYPSAYQLGQRLRETYGLTDLSNTKLTTYIEDFKQRLPAGANPSRTEWHGMNGHDHPMAVPEQRGEPRTSYGEKPGRWAPELSQPRRQDPAGDALPAGHHTRGDFISTPPADTSTPLPGPPPGEKDPMASPESEFEEETTEQPPAVETVADRYYTAWRAYRVQEGAPPNGEQLSWWLFHHGVTGRNGNAISPSTLRRYIASYPCYETWAEHADSHGHEPTAAELVKLLADRGIKRNNGGTPWELTDLEQLLPHFQKRHRLHSPH
ncbi:hypothetical protein JK364_50710, partial [Streptomyces sp. 110]|nr:hypothetical protein [Streptomyces endocoffeicus]